MFVIKLSFTQIKCLENIFQKFGENINADSSPAKVQGAMSITMKETIIC